MPLLRYYKEPENNYLCKGYCIQYSGFVIHLTWMPRLDHMGFVIVLSVAECGIGLIAGSLPMLRRLVHSWLGKDDTKVSAPTPNSNITFGGTGPSGKNSRARFQNPTDTGISRVTIKTGRPSRDWEQLDDSISSSDETNKGSNHIMEHRTVMVEFEMGELHGSKKSSTSSMERL